eukprot:gene11956-25044_t
MSAPLYRLYMCMQLPKKMHPRFDRALVGVLRQDENAIIIVNDRAKDLLPRWERTMNMSSVQLMERFVFVPRMSHRDYLSLLSMSAVFLNPFPFGSGITSSESLALCVPVVSLSVEISVLQFALAQIRKLGADMTDVMLTHSIDEYVNTAVTLAKDSQSPSQSLSSSSHLTTTDIRSRICDRRHLLFGKSVLEEAVNDWQFNLWREAGSLRKFGEIIVNNVLHQMPILKRLYEASMVILQNGNVLR